MEKLDLTPENLIKVGITPELLYDPTAFINFIENNENTFIDFDNDIIYTNLLEPLNTDLIFLKSFFESENDFIEFQNSIKEKTEITFKDVLNKIPKENSIEFLSNALPTLFDNVKKSKKVLFDIFLKEVTEPIEPNTIIKNPYPNLFKNFEVYCSFIEYTEKHIIDFHKDYSYLKKRLEHEKLTHYHKDNEFIEILFNNMKLIKQHQYNDYFTKYESKFLSLEKSKSENRLNNFNNIFRDLF